MIRDFKLGLGAFWTFLKQNKKIFIGLFAIYCFAFITIWRANYYYADDVGRAVVGYGWTSDFNRYSSSALQFFLINMNIKLVDLSPYTQVLALFLTTLSSMMLIYLFTKHDKKPSLLTVIASAFLGLCPYTAACFVYKFDAPCMALALFVSILPFLFYNSKRLLFFIISTICLFVMWTSYQSYSGVFVILALAMALKSIIENEKLSKALKNTLFCALPFLLATALYKFCLPEISGYRSLEVFSITELIPGLWKNFSEIIGLIWYSFNKFWRGLSILFFVTFFISLFLQKSTIKQKFRNFVFSLLFMVFSFALAVGASILLKEALYPPRFFCGVSMIFAVFGLFIAYNLESKEEKNFGKVFLIFPMVLLLYQFFVFEIAFGNALADQWNYSDYRNEMLAKDLADSFTSRQTQGETKLQVQGTINYSRITSHIAEQYPIINELIRDESIGLSEHVWGLQRLYSNYGLGFKDGCVYLEGRYDCGSMEVIKDSAYHTIHVKDGLACVVLK